MIADMKAFGLMDNYTANDELKRNLAEVKRAAELLMNLLDLLMGRIQFEPGETDKYINLRQAILDFRSLEVNPGLPFNMVIDQDNLENIKKYYGVLTDTGKNALINAMVRDTILKTKNKINTDALKAKCEQQKGKLQKALDKIEPSA